MTFDIFVLYVLYISEYNETGLYHSIVLEGCEKVYIDHCIYIDGKLKRVVTGATTHLIKENPQRGHLSVTINRGTMLVIGIVSKQVRKSRNLLRT
jgi:hypothetical protein